MLAFAEWLQGTAPSLLIQSVGWIIPALQTVHIVMIGLVLVAVLVVALRVLGLVRTDQSPAEVVARFLPWFWAGLLVNLATGLLLVVGEPVREVTALSFWLKMGLVLAGAAGVLAVARRLRRETGRPGPAARAGAVGLVVLWLAVIVLGRAIAYDIEVWGRWSPTAGA